MITWYKSKRNEKAAATMIIVLWGVILLTILVALLLDLSKNLEMRNVQHSMAQTSAEYGVKTLSPTGRLGAPAVDAAIKEYKRQRNNTLPDGSLQEGKISDYKTWTSPACNKVMVNGVEKTAPYFEATVYKGRGNDSNPIKFSIDSDGKATQLNDGTLGVPYLRLDFTVHDTVRNMMLGVANIIPGIDNNFGCQKITTKISALAFASQEDINKGSGTFNPNS